MEGRAFTGGTAVARIKCHHPAGRVKVYDSVVNFLDKGDSGARLRRPDSARWIMGMFQGVIPRSVLLPVCSYGVSRLSFSTDICVLVLKPFYAGASPMATPCVRVMEFKLCMALLAWDQFHFYLVVS